MPASSAPLGPESYGNLRYRIRFDGRYVAGVNQASGLLRSVAGGERASTPGRPPRRPPVVLERGVSRDGEFLPWLAALSAQPQGRADHPTAPRRDVQLELRNEGGHLVVAYYIHRCWPVLCETLPVCGAGDALSLIERLVFDHEGFERDIDHVRAAG